MYNPRKSTAAPYGPVNIYKGEKTGIISPLYLCFSIYNILPDFLFYRFKSPVWYPYVYSHGDTGVRFDRVSIKDDVFFDMPIYTPTQNEQEKIAKLLSLIDERIATQNKIIEDLKKLRSAIRTLIFTRVGSISNSVRNVKIGDFLEHHTEYNINNDLRPVSIGKYGIRMRDEIYSKELSTDYTKNKVIKQDMLVIGMGSTQIDIGILFDDKQYCVSPAYSTYKIKRIHSKYLNEYLIYLNPLLSKRYMIIGVRQGKSVNKEEFMQHALLIHDENEQKRISNLFDILNRYIKVEQEILHHYITQKQHLLRQMFI